MCLSWRSRCPARVALAQPRRHPQRSPGLWLGPRLAPGSWRAHSHARMHASGCCRVWSVGCLVSAHPAARVVGGVRPWGLRGAWSQPCSFVQRSALPVRLHGAVSQGGRWLLLPRVARARGICVCARVCCCVQCARLPDWARGRLPGPVDRRRHLAQVGRHFRIGNSEPCSKLLAPGRHFMPVVRLPAHPFVCSNVSSREKWHCFSFEQLVFSRRLRSWG